MRQEPPNSRTLVRWSPKIDHKAQSDMKQSDINTLADIVDGFSKAR